MCYKIFGVSASEAGNYLTEVCYGAAKRNGWHPNREGESEEIKLLRVATKLALIHSEISEALEGFRKGTQDPHLPHRTSAEVELADAVIRIFDLAGAEKLDLGGAIAEKLSYNDQRADHKMDARNAPGGKKF